MMIVSFFYLLSYVLKIFKTRILKKKPLKDNLIKSDVIHLLDCLDLDRAAVFDDEVGIRFLPPVYSQRYHAVYDILTQLQLFFDIKKVVDIGCSEISLFTFVKRLEFVEEYIGVDIDLPTLDRFSCRVVPLTTDYLTKRCSPLKVYILNGSAVKPDERLKNANAIIAIELIEHMFPPELDDLPYNIFGVIQPNVAIITTPNADFNVVFKNLKQNEFRHHDHKFEWSQDQFKDWGNNLILRYPAYSVWFNGIGKGPDGTEAFGCCSQIAVFVRTKSKTVTNEFNVFYKSVYEVQYPYQTQEEKYNETLEYEVFLFIDQFSKDDEYLVGDKIKIPLVDILNYINVPCSEEKLKDFLEGSKKHVECVNNKFKLVLPSYADENTSLSSFNGSSEAINYYKDEEENWSLGLNGVSHNVVVSNDEIWDFELENVNGEMKPNGNFSESDLNGPITEEDNDSEVIDHSCINTRKDVEPKVENHNYSCSSAPADDLKRNNSESLIALSDGHYESAIPAIKVLEEIHRQDRKVVTFPEHSTSTSTAIPEVNNTSENTSIKSTIVFRSKEGIAKDDNIVDNVAISTKDAHLLEKRNIVEDLFSEQSQHSLISPFSIHPKTSEKMLDSVHNITHIDISSDNVMYDENQKEKFLKIRETTEQSTSNSEAFTGQCIGTCSHVTTVDMNVKEGSYDQCSSDAFPKSHSLENVNMYNCKNKNFRYSLNIDNKQLDCDNGIVDMELDTSCKGSSLPSLTETYGSQSKAVDSGYPNSTQDMDLDLTPEQVDEIITETESSLEDEESSADERVEQVQGNPPLLFADNVENGDVANNNRDGEGNNMEGGHVLAEELVFEDLMLDGEEVEAGGEHESDDEGLFMSALDVSNGTLVPEEPSSAEDTVYLFDLPSTSSVGSIQIEESIAHIHPLNEFPSWLLNMITQDDDHGSGDAGPDRDEDSSELVMDREGQVDFYPDDARAGGEPTSPEG